MIKRVIDKQTKLFLRDDFTFNPETEIGLEVEPSQGLYAPKWNSETWKESATQEYVDSLKAQAEPEAISLEERVTATETSVVTLQETIDVIFGGV